MLREVSVQDIEMNQPEHGMVLRESAVENDRVSKQYSYVTECLIGCIGMMQYMEVLKRKVEYYKEQKQQSLLGDDQQESFEFFYFGSSEEMTCAVCMGMGEAKESKREL